MTRSMIDAAWPPSQPPKVNAVAFYIGGGTPHVWTQAELDATMRKAGATRKLPIFVRVPPTTHDAEADADFCIRWAKAHNQPQGTVIALDYETAVDPWWFGFDRRVQAAGYKTLLYGTLRTVVQNVIRLPNGSSRHPSGGYWSAHWTNTPHICPNPYVTATQYGGDVTLGQPWDISLVADAVPLWDTQGDDMTGEEHDALIEARDLLKLLIYGDRRGEGLDTHDFISMEGHYDILKGLQGDLDAVKAAVQEAADPATVAALVAGKLEITGIETDPGGLVTVTFGPKAAP